VIDPSPDDAQAESSNTINSAKKPAMTACLITNDEPIHRHPGRKQPCSASWLELRPQTLRRDGRCRFA
jgi:hypothetical protein